MRLLSKKFWQDAADTFMVAAATVAVYDIDVLLSVGSTEQLGVAALALVRASLIAGFYAVRPKFDALDEPEDE